MRAKAKKRRKRNYILAVALCVFSVYLAVTLIGAQLQIRKKQTEFAVLRSQYQAQQSKNEEINRVLSGNSSEYVKSIARDKLNYADPNERIYIDVSGN